MHDTISLYVSFFSQAMKFGHEKPEFAREAIEMRAPARLSQSAPHYVLEIVVNLVRTNAGEHYVGQYGVGPMNYRPTYMFHITLSRCKPFLDLDCRHGLGTHQISARLFGINIIAGQNHFRNFRRLANFSNLSVLVVEDSLSQRKIMIRRLKKVGHVIRYFEDKVDISLPMRPPIVVSSNTHGFRSSFISSSNGNSDSYENEAKQHYYPDAAYVEEKLSHEGGGSVWYIGEAKTVQIS
jgi:hypothetical protein